MTLFLHVQGVIDIHDQLIDTFGGLFGIRDLGLLTSAIAMPKSKIQKTFLHPSIYDQAAAYLFHICRNHPFLDGNRRTATISALVFFENNTVSLEFDEHEFENLVVETAIGNVNKTDLSFFLQQGRNVNT